MAQSVKRVALVTGGSSGIGLCTCKALHEAGYTVFELSRREVKNDFATHVFGDVTKPESLVSAVKEIVEKAGSIDVLVNNAGFGISGAVEFTDTEDAKRLFDVNTFGMMNAAQAVIPVMRNQGGGRIINLSSVAAPLSIPFQAYYSASKAAVNALSLALANELRPFGISVTAVMPGDIKTGFTAAREKDHRGDDVYGGRIERSVSVMERDEQGGMSPEFAGLFLSKIAKKKRVKPFYVIGFKYKVFVLLSKILPASLVNRVVGLLYAK